MKMPPKFASHVAAIIAALFSSLGHTERASAQAIDIATTAQIDSGIALANGSAVPTGSLMAFGYYPTALTGPLTGVSGMSDILNPGGSNAFVTIFTGTMGFDDGFGGFYEGLFAAGIQSTDDTIVGKQLYYIVANNSSSLLNATEAGVFTSPNWLIPSLGDPVPTLFATDINEVPRDSTGILFGTSGVGQSLAAIAGADPALPNYNLQAFAAPPPSVVGPGSYSFPSGEKAKIGVEPIEGAQYQWLKGGLPVRLARSHELDLTPGQSTFGPAQAGIYQLQMRQGTSTETLGPWIVTHVDPTILVYDLVLKGTQSTPPEDARVAGASEIPVTLGGFLLLDRSADEAGMAAVLILTRTDRIGNKIVGRFYWSEERPDVSLHSNGPVPGTAKFRPSRTLAAGLRGTRAEALDGEPEAPLWLAGDRDMLWLSGSDALVKLDRSRTPQLIIAPATMTGLMGTATTTGGVEIDNFSVTAKINTADTLKARIDNSPLEQMKDSIIARLEASVPPFTALE